MAQGLGLETEMKLLQLKDAWNHLVGKTIAIHTLPQKIRFKTLTLLVDGPTWMHELTFLKQEIIEKINRTLGKEVINALRLRQGQLPSPTISPQERGRNERKDLSKEELALLGQQLSSMSDDHLKHVIHRAMEKHLRVKLKRRPG